MQQAFEDKVAEDCARVDITKPVGTMAESSIVVGEIIEDDAKVIAEDPMTDATNVDVEEKAADDRALDENSAAVIAEQAQQIYQKGKAWRKRRDTFFYTVVLGGNAEAIKETLNYMQDNAMEEVQDWLLRRDPPRSKATNFFYKALSYFGHAVIVPILLVVNVLLTPVFYILHFLACALMSKRQQQICEDIHLPLVYAALSQEPEMYELFSGLTGVSIMDRDTNGNNIFHYIADLSTEAPDQAGAIFKTLMGTVPDVDSLKNLIVEQRNNAGLSALEFTAKFGSPMLLSEVLQYPNLLQHSVLKVHKEKVSIGSIGSDREDCMEKASAKIDHLNVSEHECGGLVHQSTLLNIISARDLMVMSPTDLKLFQKTSVLHTWMLLKVKQMLLKLFTLHVLDIIVTSILVLVAKDLILFRTTAWELHAYKIMQSEIKALSENNSHIFKPDAFPKVLDRMQKFLHMYVAFERMDEVEKRDLLEKTALGHPELAANISADNDVKSLDNDDILHAVVDTALGNKNYSTWQDFYIFEHLRDLLVEYAKVACVISHTPHAQDNPSMVITEHGNFSYEYLHYHFSIFICGFKYDIIFTIDDLVITSPVIEAITRNKPNDACLLRAWLDLSNANCRYLSPEEAFKGLGIQFHKTSFALLHVVALALFLYVLLDLTERSCFLFVQAAHKWGKPYAMLKTCLGTKMPGSYVRKQMNILSVVCCAASILPMELPMVLAYSLENHNMFMMFSLVFRLITHIHALRLVPSIGHFVVTMFQMGTNMLHFSAIYTIVIVIFGVIFHKILVNPECPAERFVEFQTVTESVLSTFGLAFGLTSDVTQYRSNATAAVTYVLYLVFMGLLLMNLIIAIMSSTATDVMREPWMTVLWTMEWVQEALSAEFTFSVLGLPFGCRSRCHRNCRCCFTSHRLAGFVVKKHRSNGTESNGTEGDGIRIYVPTTSWPKLRPQH